MESLKMVKSFSWDMVDQQAAAIANYIREAKASNANAVEYQGDIHPVNREILAANGFNVYSTNNGRTFTISWTRYAPHEDAESLSSCDCSDSEDEDCCCDGCECGDKASPAAGDDVKKILTFILSSMGKAEDKK